MNKLEKITSVKNAKILEILELKKIRIQKQEKKYIVEGFNLVQEGMKNGVVELILGTKKYSGLIDEEKFIEITDNVANKLSDLTNTQEIFAVCNFKPKDFNDSNVLVLDDIQDPGNLGTLIRSAYAFGFENILCSEKTVWIYNQKVLRATQGNHFQLNFKIGILEEEMKKLKENNFIILGTSLNLDNNIDITTLKDKKIALVLGNEGQGVSESIKNICDYNIVLKTNKNVDSLNVSVAGSIIMNNIYSNS